MYLGLWLVLAVLDLLCFCCLYWTCCLEKFFGICCKCCKRSNNPGKCTRRCYPICVLLMLAISCLVSGLGFITDATLIKGFRMTGCTLTGFLHEFIHGTIGVAVAEGEAPPIWLGVVGVRSEADSLISYLENDLPSKIMNRFDQTDFIAAQKDILLASLNDAYLAHFATTVATPDPSAVAGTTINPDYFSVRDTWTPWGFGGLMVICVEPWT